MATAMTGGTSKLVLSQKTDSGNTVSLYVYYKIDSQNITNNKTTLKLGMYVTVSGGGSIGPWSNNENSYLGTTSITFSSAIPSVSSGSTYWIASEKAMTVEHESDGTGSTDIKWKWGVYSTWGNVIRPSGSFTITLPTIERESTFTISPSSGNKIGNKPTFNIEAKNSSFTHTLQYKYGNQTSYTTIVSKTSSKAYSSWAIPVGAYEFLDENTDQLKRKTPISIKCITYNGSTKIGEVVKTLNAYSKGGSSFSIGTCYIGEKATISISKTDSSFTHILGYKYTNSTKYFKITEEKTSSSKISWNIPKDEFYKKIPNDKKLDIVLNCDSYYKDVFVGSNRLDVTVLCKEALCKPVFGEVSIIDTGTRTTKLTNNSNKFIRGYNKLNFNFSPVAQNNAAGITKVVLSCGSLSKVLLAEEGRVLDSNLSLGLDHVTEKTVKCTIFDSRGYDNTFTQDIDLIDYFKPEVIISASAVPDYENVDNNQATDEEGNQYDATPVKLALSLTGKIFNKNFGEQGIKNTASKIDNTDNFYIKYRFGISSDFSNIEWNEMKVEFDEKNENNCKNSEEIFACFPEQENYYLQVLIQDAVYHDGSSLKNILIEKVVNYIPVFDWGNNDFQFNVPVVLKKGGFYNYESENKTEAKQNASLNMNNGDLVGCNAIIFNDATNNNEGLFFPNGSHWDVLRIYQGRLQIIPKFGSKDVSDPFDESQYSIYSLFYKPGDTITYSNDLFPSFCGFFSSTGTKTLFITIPFSKPCFGCTSARLSGILRIRTIDGTMKTINMNSLPAEVSSVTVVCHEDTGLVLEILFREAKNSLLDFSTFQHTPISCSFASEVTVTLA
ncbi:MAG: DUF859 family phage minor structural protein [Treponemataceae bacterium]|nr:DUF859 family phage minor structural protein [Treponemataceae bacterium]